MSENINNPDQLHVLAHTEAERGNFYKAITLMTKAIDTNPLSIDFYFCRGNFNLEIHSYEDALSDYNYYITYSNGEKDDLAYHNMGVIYANLHLENESFEYFTKAIQLSPDFVAAYHSRAHILLMQKRFQEAIEDLSAAIHIEEDSSNLYLCRGKSKFDLGDNLGALLDFEMVKRLEERVDSPLFLQADNYIKAVKNRLC